MNKFLLILVFALTLFSCSEENDPLPEPQADFTADRFSIEKGETIQFTNNSMNSVRYEWDFGNGQSSTIKNPTMKFDQAGTFTVSLSAYNEEEKMHSSSIDINVKAKPEAVADFFITSIWGGSLIENGKPIELFNNSTNAVRYEWDFGNGKTSTSESPSVVFEKAGNYKVTLAAYNEDDVVNNYSMNLTVGKRYLVGFNIHDISFLDLNNQAWDIDGSGPDLIFALRSSKDAMHSETYVAYDIKQSDLSFSLVPKDENLVLTDATWIFDLYDLDNDLNGSEIMAKWEFNPKGKGVSNFIQMTGTNYDIELLYEVR